jgi:CheY-like chemotaxis protein
MTRDFKVDAVTLDLHLPDIDGWRVLERLKNDFKTRHLPVCVISTDDARERGLELGALNVVAKPVPTKEVLERALDRLKECLGRPVKDLLVATNDSARRAKLLELFSDGTIRAIAVGGGREALNSLRTGRFDGLVLDPQLPDMNLSGFADAASGEPALAELPLFIYGGNGVSDEDEAALQRLGRITKMRNVDSEEQLLDQTTLLLHCPLATLPITRRLALESVHGSDQALAGKKALIVDDDIRNIFALTSVLERYNMETVSAETGREAIRLLKEEPRIDVVLMDIMMPEMDGMDTMRAIRQLPQFKSLPIIAVTAKAMKGDREKCIEAGAWDYLSKPVDTEQMMSILRSWLHR